MDKYMLANINPKRRLLRLLIFGTLVVPLAGGCSKNPETDPKKQQPAMATFMDSLPTIPVPDSLPIAPTIIVNEHGFLTIDWINNPSLLNRDSVNNIATNSHYTDVIIKTPTLQYNLITVSAEPWWFDIVRDTLTARVIELGGLDSNRNRTRRVRGGGRLYVANKCVDTLPAGAWGMTSEQSQWFKDFGFIVTDTCLWYNVNVPDTNKTIFWNDALYNKNHQGTTDTECKAIVEKRQHANKRPSPFVFNPAAVHRHNANGRF